MSNIYLITPNKGEAGSVETLPQTEGMTILSDLDLSNSDLSFSIDEKVCITSESSIETVKERLGNVNKIKAIDSLKDKIKFREIISKWYPEYKFESLAFDEIPTLKINHKAILKPSKGCFGTGVKLVDSDTDFEKIANKIRSELEKNSAVLSENVLSTNEFILEEYIEGDEYAVDMFYDENGSPVIVNIYHHPMPAMDEYLHMIYYSSYDVHQKIYDKAKEFFKELNQSLQVKNLAMHSEFRLGKALIPIEINCMRFGGMGLGNMIYYAAGINPYDYFRMNKKPNWELVWNNHGDDIFAFFIAYNGCDIDIQKYKPNIAKLESEFTNVIHHQLFDYQKQLAFGIYYLKEKKDKIDELLQIDFNDYFVKI